MNTRRLSTLLLGVWIGISASMFVVATANFTQVEQRLERPSAPASQAIKQLGATALPFLRHHAGELNRYLFGVYGWTQVAVALGLGVTLLFATNGRVWILTLAGGLVVITLVQCLFLFPEIDYLGRMLDFDQSGQRTAARERFESFHTAFGVTEALKFLVMAVIGGKMLLSRMDRRRRPREAPFDVVSGLPSR